MLFKESYMEDYKAQYYNEALLHYGVKGMRWGVRKKRETKGRRRKSKKDDVKEKRYVKKATKQASTKASKIALSAIAFGCTALAVGVFFAETGHRDAFSSALRYVTSKTPNPFNKKRQMMTKGNDVLVDVRELTHRIAKGISPELGMIIPKGQRFSRITRNQDFSLKNHHGGIYAAFSNKDIRFYKNHINPMDGKGGRRQIFMKNKKDLYIPSRAAAEELYQNLMKNDKNYRKDMNRAMYRMLYKRHVGTYGPEKTGQMVRDTIEKMWKADPDGFYFQNTVMTNKGKAYRKYARALKKAGYDGVLDYHDIDDKLSVAPIILTNKDKLKVARKRKLLF